MSSWMDKPDAARRLKQRRLGAGTARASAMVAAATARDACFSVGSRVGMTAGNRLMGNAGPEAIIPQVRRSEP